MTLPCNLSIINNQEGNDRKFVTWHREDYPLWCADLLEWTRKRISGNVVGEREIHLFLHKIVMLW